MDHSGKKSLKIFFEDADLGRLISRGSTTRLASEIPFPSAGGEEKNFITVLQCRFSYKLCSKHVLVTGHNKNNNDFNECYCL